MATITANGVGIHYERTGGDKPPVVLLHGIRDSSRCWPRVQAALAGGYDVIALDARGHGRSAAPEKGYSIDILADDVAGVIAALGLKQPAVLGHSLGAMTAANLAARYPDVVRCIVLEDPPWRYTETMVEEWAAVMDNFRASAVTLQSMSSAELLAYAMRMNPRMALWDESDRAGWVDAKQRLSLFVMDGLRSDTPRWRADVPRLACPALILAGEPALGGFCPPQTVQQIRALNPAVSVISIAAAGHQIRREAFSAYIEAVQGFLDAHTMRR